MDGGHELWWYQLSSRALHATLMRCRKESEFKSWLFFCIVLWVVVEEKLTETKVKPLNSYSFPTFFWGKRSLGPGPLPAMMFWYCFWLNLWLGIGSVKRSWDSSHDVQDVCTKFSRSWRYGWPLWRIPWRSWKGSKRVATLGLCRIQVRSDSILSFCEQILDLNWIPIFSETIVTCRLWLEEILYLERGALFNALFFWGVPCLKNRQPVAVRQAGRSPGNGCNGASLQGKSDRDCCHTCCHRRSIDVWSVMEWVS